MRTENWGDDRDFIQSDIDMDFLSFQYCGEVDVNKGLIVLIIVVCVLILVFM